MADKKISQLTGGGASQATDEYVIARSGNNFKVTGANIAAAATSVGTLTSLTVSGNVTLNSASGSVAINATPSITHQLIVKGTTSDSTRNAFLIRDSADASIAAFRNDKLIDLYGSVIIAGNLTVDTNTLFVDAVNNRTLMGITTARNVGYGDSGRLNIEGTSYSTAAIAVVNNSNNGDAPSLSFGKSRGTTTGSYTAVQSGDILGIIDFVGANGSAFNVAARIVAAVDGAVSGGGANDMPGRLEFYTTADGSGSPTERMRLDASGNLGLGVTPSAWALSGASAMQVKNAAFWGYVNNAYVSANEYLDSAGTPKYIAAAAATRYKTGAGTHEWYNAPAGLNANDPITFTQAMTLDASGQLLVGSTTFAGWGTSGRLKIKQSTANNYDGVLVTSSTNENGVFMGHTGSVGQFGTDNGTGGGLTPVEIRVGSTVGIRINTTANVGIGTTNPSNARLEVVATSGEVFRADAAAGALRIVADQNGVTTAGNFISNSSNNTLYVSATNNNVGIRCVPDSASALDVTGRATVRSATVTTKTLGFSIGSSGPTINYSDTDVTPGTFQFRMQAGATKAYFPYAGGFVISDGGAALATTATDGFLYVPTCAGTPTGTPTTQAGSAPIVIDTTNNKLYFYSGAAWRDAGP